MGRAAGSQDAHASASSSRPGEGAGVALGSRLGGSMGPADSLAVRRAAREAAVAGVAGHSVTLGVRRVVPQRQRSLAGGGGGKAVGGGLGASASVTTFEDSGMLPVAAAREGRRSGRLPSLPAPANTPAATSSSSSGAARGAQVPWGRDSRSSLAQGGLSETRAGEGEGGVTVDQLDALHRDCVVAAVQREELLRRAVRLGAHAAAAEKAARESAPTGTRQQRQAVAAARAQARESAEDLVHRLREAGMQLVGAVARWRAASRSRWAAQREAAAARQGAVPSALVQLEEDAVRRERASGPAAGEEGGGHWPPFVHGGVPYLGKAMGDLQVVGAALPWLGAAVRRRGRAGRGGPSAGLGATASSASAASRGDGWSLESKTQPDGRRSPGVGGEAHSARGRWAGGGKDGGHDAGAGGGIAAGRGQEMDGEEAPPLPALDGNPLLLADAERRRADADRSRAARDLHSITGGPQLLPPVPGAPGPGGEQLRDE